MLLGITLKISLSPVDGGGYPAYFSSDDKVIAGLTIPDSKRFARKYMDLHRYRQIRGAFHPVNGVAGAMGDKAYHL